MASLDELAYNPAVSMHVHPRSRTQEPTRKARLRLLASARTQRARARRRQHLMCVMAEVGELGLELLVQARFLRDADASDPVAVGRAVTEMIAISAKAELG